ncbi:MAG: DsrE family protein [bacterium]|nr:DsrE family protein [bacterium]
METPKKLLIIQTSGIGAPERLPPAFFMAATGAAMNMDATMVFTADGATVLEKQAAAQVRIKEKGAAVQTFLDQAISAGVKLMVCHQSLDIHDLEPDSLIDEVEDIIGAATLLDLTLEADVVLTF